EAHPMLRTSPKPRTHKGRRRWLVAPLALAAVAVAAPAIAAPVGFATFNQTAGRPFMVTNNTASGSLGWASGQQVTFNFRAETGLPTVDHMATVTLTGTTTTPGSFVTSTLMHQPIMPATGQLKITEVGTLKNLLTMTFTGD